MKSLIKYGLAAAMLVATAMPAMARSWVVCVDQNKDARVSSETVSGAPVFFVGAAPVYPGGTDVGLAMERGEVKGRCGWSWSSVKSTHMAWLTEKKINILVQLALQKHPELPDVPLIVDLAKTDEQRQVLKLIFARQVMGRPFLAPPNIPADRVMVLRKAFMATLADKDFLADAEKSQLEINPVAGDEIEKLVKEIYASPPEVAKKAAELLK